MISEAVVTNKLESLVAAAIEKTPELARRHLRFETQDGHVTLRGSVATYFQKQVAQETIRRIDGVAAVSNELEVVWS
ncbi:MAG: BON domain-containing protein [Pirellulaceae bacterium]|nr:BON domain-containing protein [Planctomycetales bacterium]